MSTSFCYGSPPSSQSGRQAPSTLVSSWLPSWFAVLFLAAFTLVGACEDSGVGVGGACVSDEECVGDLSCIYGICTRPVQSQSCVADLQCGLDKHCLHGLCVDASVRCLLADDCPEGLTCLDGVCTTTQTCGNDEECPASFICESSACVAGCTGPADCPGQTCLGGRCVDSGLVCSDPQDCDDDNDCTQDLCNDSLCSHPVALADGCCTGDSDCSAEADCTLAVCEEHHCQQMPDPACCVDVFDCDDGDSFTIDSCDNGTCVNEPVETCSSDGQCDDQNPCTTDTCEGQLCVNAPTQDPNCCVQDEQCSDDDPTTKDRCLENQCEHLPEGTCLTLEDCESANPCMEAECTDGECVWTPGGFSSCACQRDADCEGDKGGACILFEPDESSVITVCADALGAGLAGEHCVFGFQCASGLCMGLSTGNVCFGACIADEDCLAESECSVIQYPLEDGTYETVPACVNPLQECTNNEMCPSGMLCSPVEGEQEGTIDLGCLPGDGGGIKGTGAACTEDAECSSGICISAPELGSTQVCWGACENDSDCPLGGQKCYPNRLYFVFDQGTEEPYDDGYFGMAACLPDIGSYNTCLSDKTCTSTEYCNLYLNTYRTDWDLRCVSKPGTGSLSAGATCIADSQCRSGTCVALSGYSVCFGTCQSLTDCYGTTTCNYVSDFIIEDFDDADDTNDITAPISVCY